MLFELASIAWGTGEVVVAAITIEAATKTVIAAGVIAVAVNQRANIVEDIANSEREKLIGKNWEGKKVYAPDRPLPKDENGIFIPDTDAPHTQLGTRNGRKEKYVQGREFDKEGKPVKNIHFTDHGRPGKHPNPHQHRREENFTGGTKTREDAEPLSGWKY